MSITSGTPTFTDKGSRYLVQLDQALCNGSWSEISDLSRKVDKHAPQRKCFTLAARCEAQIAQSLQRSSPSLSKDELTKGFNDLASQLLHAVLKEEHFTDDAYVAQVCVAEIRWLKGEYQDAIEALSHDKKPAAPATGHIAALGWMDVCEVKADIIHLASYLELTRVDDARQICLKAVTRVPGSRTPELRRWTERLLARVCIFMNRGSKEPTLHSLSQSLRCFNAWSDFWRRSSSSSSGSSATNAIIDVPRRQVWRAYYDLVTIVLQHGLMYNVAPTSATDLLMMPLDVSDEDYAAAQTRQRSALRTVEVNYESLLLNETQFPKASDTNTEVEEWVQKAVSNWKVFSGPAWSEDSLGEGGKESLARGVLDILYRSATKTYHSTAILRYLFTVHTSVGEFDLAMLAFKSYREIFSKDRLRAEKTGTHDIAFDSDDSAIVTAAETIRVLCRYGDREQGERAVEVGKTIREWLGDDGTTHKNATDPSRTDETVDSKKLGTDRLQASTLAAAYRAIGISKASWARLTYETNLRSELREEALASIRTAQKHDVTSIETGYACALLLAEGKDVQGAVSLLKHVIARSASAEGTERLLLPIWHLLALCLTAQESYEQAMQMCDAAFEQFGDSQVLFGEADERTSSDMDDISLKRLKNGLVDHMEGYEKETLLQIKMSQITLLELTEGVEAAVDSSYELLALYARLFGTPKFNRPGTNIQPPATAVSATPSKLGGTLKSIAGSIRPRSMRQSMERDPRTASMLSVSARRDNAANGTPQKSHEDQNFGVPIAITVTNEKGVPTEKSSHPKHLPFHRRGEHGSLRAKSSPHNNQETSERPTTPFIRTTTPNGGLFDNFATSEKDLAQTVAGSPDQKLETVPHNFAHHEMPPPQGHEDQPPQQDVRLPAPHPSTYLVPDARLPKAQDRQQRISLLVKLWLFIAGLYLRAELLEDAGNAVDEAGTLVESFETEVGAEHANAQRFHNKGWGGGKSVDDLWADVWSARGYLAVARKLPFEALGHFEQALAYFPDHADGIVGLSNILMDIFEEKIPPEEPRIPLAQRPSASSQTISLPVPPTPQPPPNTTTPSEPQAATTRPGDPGQRAKPSRDLPPAELNRLAARDRAYMLLTNLTRLGSGWDNTEAWSTLARAHELSKQISKAKEALWWVVELEENEPMRPWNQVAPGGYTL